MVELADLGQVAIRQEGLLEHQLTAVRRRLVEQVLLRADKRLERGDELLADRVEGRVADLSEELTEVAEEQRVGIRQDGKGRIVAHRADRLGAGCDHRLEDDVDVLLRVAEDLLTLAQGVRLEGGDVRGLRQRVQDDALLLQPLAVGTPGAELALDLGVVDQTALRQVEEEHAPGLDAALEQHFLRRHVEDAGLGGHNEQVVRRHQVAAGTQSVAVQDAADLVAVGSDHQGRPVPGLHEAGMVLVEGLLLGVHRNVVRPGLRDEHHQGVRQRAAAGEQQLEGVVECRRVALARRHDRDDLLYVLAKQR